LKLKKNVKKIKKMKKYPQITEIILNTNNFHRAIPDLHQASHILHSSHHT